MQVSEYYLILYKDIQSRMKQLTPFFWKFDNASQC